MQDADHCPAESETTHGEATPPTPPPTPFGFNGSLRSPSHPTFCNPAGVCRMRMRGIGVSISAHWAKRMDSQSAVGAVTWGYVALLPARCHRRPPLRPRFGQKSSEAIPVSGGPFKCDDRANLAGWTLGVVEEVEGIVDGFVESH